MIEATLQSMFQVLFVIDALVLIIKSVAKINSNSDNHLKSLIWVNSILTEHVV